MNTDIIIICARISNHSSSFWPLTTNEGTHFFLNQSSVYSSVTPKYDYPVIEVVGNKKNTLRPSVEIGQLFPIHNPPYKQREGHSKHASFSFTVHDVFDEHATGRHCHHTLESTLQWN